MRQDDGTDNFLPAIEGLTEKLHEAVDAIKDRFGEGAIKHRK